MCWQRWLKGRQKARWWLIIMSLMWVTVITKLIYPLLRSFRCVFFSPGFPPQHEIQTNCLYIYILRIFVDQLVYKIKGISRHSHIHPPSDRVIDLRFIAHFSIPSIQSSWMVYRVWCGKVLLWRLKLALPSKVRRQPIIFVPVWTAPALQQNDSASF